MRAFDEEAFFAGEFFMSLAAGRCGGGGANFL